MGAEESKSARQPTEWEPYSYCDSSVNWEARRKPPFALIILNQKISNKKLFFALWRNSHLQVCADGGANRLHDSLNEDERETFLPDNIIGDLDSLRDDVRAFYEARGVKVTRDPDQDSTDFGKCMDYIASYDVPDACITSFSSSFDSSRSAQGTRVEYPKMTVVALGGFGGRVDQSFHAIHALHTAQQGPGLPRQVFLISEQNITFLLQSGANVLYMPRAFLGPCCGIIPVGTPAIITTKGFEWNLTGAETKFGGMVSTSNHIVKDEVSVETTEPIVFTIEFREIEKTI